MIFIDKMKNMKIYKTQMFLPTVDGNKKKESAILLLTPNYESSKKILSNPLMINRKRFESYYINKDVSFYIGGKNLKEVYNDPEADSVEESSIYLNEITSTLRNSLSDDQFGIPELRKYPLDTKSRVKSAIKFFNYCEEEYRKTLANNIKKAIKKFNLEDEIKYSDKNDFFKYYKVSVSETAEPGYTYFQDASGLEIEEEFGVISDNGSYNACIRVKGIDAVLRGRSEMLLINPVRNLIFLELKDDSEYNIPGGGWDKDEPHDRTAIRETEEEVYYKVKDVMYYAPTLCYNSEPEEWIKKHVKDEKNWWTGYYSEVYVGSVDGKFTGKVAAVDKDSLAKKGKWHKIIDVYDKLSEAHQKALKQYYDTQKLDSSGVFTESFDTQLALNELSNVINTGDKIILFNEDANDAQLKRLIYNSRMKTRKEVILLYDQVKKDFPFIKYTFPDLAKYQKRNVFVDLYFYTNIFFENNTWTLMKGFRLFSEFMNRLINNPQLDSAGYKKKTIIIPIKDWAKGAGANMWNYRLSLNPISVIYNLLFTGNINTLKNIFKDNDIIFLDNGRYFKMNFSTIDPKDVKKITIKFKSFIVKIYKNEVFDPDDVDTSADNIQSSDVIRANIVDKIEDSKGVDLTAQVKKAEEKKKNIIATGKPEVKKASTKKVADIKPETNEDKVISKGTLNQNTEDSDKKINDDIDKLASKIVDATDDANSEDDAYDNLNDDEIKSILMDLDSVGSDNVDITASRSNRIKELDNKLMNTVVKGKTVKDILDNNNAKKEVETTKLNISTPNEEWKELKFVNFDKDYDIDKDIISIFRHFENVSMPIAIRNINVVNNSTSEDRVELYTVEMEDYRGKRFTIKLDIPIMVDNRFLLRGNYKSVQTQFFNMPIIKTEFDTCQLVSNYMKIFVRKYGDGYGKSLPLTSRFLKAINKYTGRKIKVNAGNNRKVCAGYDLPIDYIDLASELSTIEVGDIIIYFNQDDIRKLYDIDLTKGIPFAYNKKEKTVIYFSYKYNIDSFIESLIYLIDRNFGSPNEFIEMVQSYKAGSISAYSRCSIMNSQIPLIVICAYHEGLRATLEKANIKYEFKDKLSKEDRNSLDTDFIQFDDGYLVYRATYNASLLLNGLKACDTEVVKLADVDKKSTYLEFLDDFGGRIKADGLDNFYDLMIDPLTKPILEFYKFPTDYISMLLYANALLADNKFISHGDTTSRRYRRYELISVYTYKVLADAYALYANQLKHTANTAEFLVKQSAVIDRFLTDSITSDDSCINALRDVETTNSVTTKGPSGMNNDRAYSLDKRSYDESMLNVLGMSTGFAGNVGITRQATINSSIGGDSGYIKPIKGDTSKMNTANTLTATEAIMPFMTTHDDPMRVAMSFVQTAKHQVRTEDSDPLLVTNGADEAMAYLTTNKFAYKAKDDGKVLEATDTYILVEYKDGSKDYINLTENIEKNSDGGYYVPLKLDMNGNIKAGSRIKKNQILAYDKYSFTKGTGESDSLAYNVGKLSKIAIINTDEGFEDSGVITEALAKKLATRINLQFTVIINKDANIFYMSQVGDQVECRDDLLVWQNPFDDEDTNSLLNTLSSDEVSDLGKNKLKTEVTGKVTGVRIYRTVELNDLSPSLKKIVKAYEAPYVEMEKKYKENNLDISQIPAHTKLPCVGKLKKAEDSVLIEFFVEYLDTVGIGDKVVYFAANKAVEKNIIPLGKEPYTEFRPNEKIDAFVSEVSIDKRLVTSTMIIGSLNKLMIELDRSVKDIMGIPYDDSQV